MGSRDMRTGWREWLLGAAVAAACFAPRAALAEEDEIKALMRDALEAQVDADPPRPELPTQANVAPRLHGRERAAQVKAQAVARWAARHDRDEDPEGAPAKAKAARAADKAAAESVSPATKRRAYGKGGRP